MLKREYAYYPFLESTKSAVKSMNIASEIDVKSLELAKQRVLIAVRQGKLPLPSYLPQEDISDQVRSYIIARLIISFIPSKIEQFVKAEATRALEICTRNHDEAFLMNELGISITKDMLVPLRDYLIYGSHFSSMLLPNKHVKNGFVRISPHELHVMLKEAIRSKISEGLPIRESLINDEIKRLLKPVVVEILSEISLRSPAIGRQSKDIAPCMEKVIEELNQGVNVPHLKRWSLAVFLIKRGWDTEKIVEIFSHAPNYDEKIVRYQLDHIKSKGYSMPSCHTLKVQGICVAECGIKNPLQFRKNKLVEKEENKSDEKEQTS